MNSMTNPWGLAVLLALASAMNPPEEDVLAALYPSLAGVAACIHADLTV